MNSISWFEGEYYEQYGGTALFLSLKSGKSTMENYAIKQKKFIKFIFIDILIYLFNMS